MFRVPTDEPAVSPETARMHGRGDDTTCPCCGGRGWTDNRWEIAREKLAAAIRAAKVCRETLS